MLSSLQVTHYEQICTYTSASLAWPQRDMSISSWWSGLPSVLASDKRERRVTLKIPCPFRVRSKKGPRVRVRELLCLSASAGTEIKGPFSGTIVPHS